MKGLTIKSNFLGFKDRQDECYTADDLTKLCKNVITADIINFRGNISYGFTDAIADEVLKKLTVKKDDKILIINDLSLHMINKLLEAGYKAENIYLAYGKWNKNATPADDETVYNLMKAFIKANVKEELNIKKLKEIFTMGIKINGIIANPPYGAIADRIDTKIISDIDYDEFICLAPLKDYSLETGNHIDFSSVGTFPPHSFGDADILTHVVKLTKADTNKFKNFKELVAAAFTVDKPMLKFMKANELATHYAIDNIKTYSSDNRTDTTFIYQLLRVLSQHTCGMDQLESKSIANEFNFNNNVITVATDEIKNTIFTKAGNSNYEAIQFATSNEKQNFVNFYKANRNFINRMIANQFIGIRDHSVCWPKVDWTRDDWTIEKILKTIANYTDEEVQAVLDTMDKDYAVKDDASIERLFGEYLHETK